MTHPSVILAEYLRQHGPLPAVGITWTPGYPEAGYCDVLRGIVYAYANDTHHSVAWRAGCYVSHCNTAAQARQLAEWIAQTERRVWIGPVVRGISSLTERDCLRVLHQLPTSEVKPWYEAYQAQEALT